MGYFCNELENSDIFYNGLYFTFHHKYKYIFLFVQYINKNGASAYMYIIDYVYMSFLIEFNNIRNFKASQSQLFL